VFLCPSTLIHNNNHYKKKQDISANATGYRINGDIQEVQSGLQIPLLANSKTSLHGNLIQDLLVDVSYETTERLHVKVCL
jgi:hypothetical protein